jgi:uncharacterized protein (DUF849 family)
MFVKAAINGGRKRSNSCLVPTTPEQIAQDSYACFKRGANVIHAHARDVNGNETIRPFEVSDMVHATKSLDENIVIGTTTGLWTCESHAERLQHVKNWKADSLPDFASITYREERADEVAELILERGMLLESAVWSMEDVPKLLESPFLHNNVRILIEPEVADVARATQLCLEIKAIFENAGVTAPFLFHGYDETFWPIVELSILEQVQTRIGFEDVDINKWGVPAKTNLDLFDSYFEILENNK